VLGALIGLERESAGKAAGLRTHLLVAVGAALATQLSQQLAGSGDLGSAADPGRIAAQVVSGIGFIGAGVILQSRGSIRGLTTAATLWVAAMIGMAAGFDAYAQAVFVTIIALVSLRGLRHLDAFLERQPQAHHLEVVWSDDAAKVDDVLEALAARGFPDHALEGAFVEEAGSGCRIKLRARKEEVPRIVFELGRSPEIREVRMV
jgi:putative Mg2+ transporter-C (MgtC) family protein